MFRLWKLEESQKHLQDLSDRNKDFYKEKTALLEEGLKKSVEKILMDQQELWNVVERISKDRNIIHMAKNALTSLADFAMNYFLGALYEFLARNKKIN